MFCRYVLKNKENFLSDYSNFGNQKYNFSVSGAFLSEYKCLNNFTFSGLDVYQDKIAEKQLKQKISQKFCQNINNIVLGNGINGILQNLVHTFVKAKSDNILTPFFTFKQVPYAVAAIGAKTRYVKMKNDFYIDFDSIIKSISKNTKFIYICNPNNPTGICENNQSIIHMANQVKIPVIVSEASIAFSENKSLLQEKNLPQNLIVLRTFSKEYGLSSIRLGYALISDKYIEKYNQTAPTHQTSAISVKIANLVFEDKAVQDNIKQIICQKQIMKNKLKEIGIETIKSQACYLMTKRPVNRVVPTMLSEHQISVCEVEGYNGNMFLRISIKNESDNNYFIKIIQKIKEELNENFFGN